MEIFNFLKSIGIFCWKADRVGIYDPLRKSFRKNHNPNRIKGVSDIIGIAPGGRLLAIEVKAPKGKLTDDQRKFLVSVQDAGGIAFISRSVKQTATELAKFYPEENMIKRYLL
jgi:hypothetical protein